MSSRAMDGAPHRLDCPSAQPDMEDAKPFGVISGTVEETRIAFFKKSAREGLKWQEVVTPDEATRIFRFGAKCEERRCGHFDGSKCNLGKNVVESLPVVVDVLPSCLIRPTCRWYHERGKEVCLRCPQIVTKIPSGDTMLNHVAEPQTL